MDYESFFAERIAGLKTEGRYRVFADLERQAGRFPIARHYRNGRHVDVTIWCSNDYLGMGQDPEVLDAMCRAVRTCGAGAGGTRNISGTNHYHVLLERELASWNGTEAALLFNSGYVANQTALMTLGKNIPGVIMYSDALNHNSMIEGVRQGQSEKHVFRHNDLEHLEELLAAADPAAPKLILFESVYSMDGDVAPIAAICDLADRYNAMTYLDEVHACGMYGLHGSGIAERDGVQHRLTMIQGTLAKAVGVIGGYIAASHTLVDFLRSFGAGFIFSSALPPSIAAAALTSIRLLRARTELRTRHQERANTLRSRLVAADIPFIASESHIVPVLIGDALLCKQASDLLLNTYGIYAQPINYPTVPRGQERLRLTPCPLHTDAMMDDLIIALKEVWQSLGLKQAA